MLRCSEQTEVIVQGIGSSALSNVISTMQARRFMRKGCETFLAVILDSKRGQVDVEKIPVVRDFSDVSLKSYRISTREGGGLSHRNCTRNSPNV